MSVNLSAIHEYVGISMLASYGLGAAVGLAAEFIAPSLSPATVGVTAFVLCCISTTLLVLAHRRLRDQTGYQSLQDMMNAGDVDV